MTTVPGGLITLEYALEGLNLTKETAPEGALTPRDTDVASYIIAATPVLERLCGALLPTTVVQRFHGGKTGILLADHIPPGATVTVTVDGVTVTDFTVDEVSGIIYAGTTPGGTVFAAGIRNVIVTMTVGYTPIPAPVQLAARELVRHWWQQGKQGNRPTFGDEASGAGTSQGFALPNRVVELCGPYMTAGFA